MRFLTPRRPRRRSRSTTLTGIDDVTYRDVVGLDALVERTHRGAEWARAARERTLALAATGEHAAGR